MKFDIFDLKDHFFFFGDIEDALADNYPDVGKVSEKNCFEKI